MQNFVRRLAGVVPRVAGCSALRTAQALRTPSLRLDQHRGLRTTAVGLGDVPPLDAPYDELYPASIKHPEEFWTKVGERIQWQTAPEKAMDSDLAEANINWYPGGKLNVSENCIDRHIAAGRGDDVALIWEADEPGSTNVTYNELLENVSRLANVLKEHGVEKGDRVVIYMPMTPSIVYAMLACARIGAIHAIVFAGFSSTSLQDRIINGGAKMVITADEGLRGGKTIPLKQTVDEAVANCPDVETVLVQTRTGADVNMGPKDVVMETAMAAASPECPIEYVDAADPLFLLYTSGSTGTPKGLQHSSGGYLSYASFTHERIFDYKRGDVYACVADAGWITGHSYVVYGPLANGATSVIFESIPTYPDAGRYWEMVERLKINQFYTAPTAIRLLIKSGEDYVKKYDRSSLKVLGSVGEPINPEAWEWYNKVVGEEKCPIVDTWWQTETGGIMMTPLPEDHGNLKPGAATKPFFGVEPVLIDGDVNELEGDNQSGYLCFKQISSSMTQTVYNDKERFKKVYFDVGACLELDPPQESYCPGLYFTGDGARRDEDGDWWITGRVDDVINVSGHRLGTAEVENALVEHESVAEAAVVGFPHEVKGQGVYAFVTLIDGVEYTDEIEVELKAVVSKLVGGFARPDMIQSAPGLPKTRSGKIMRRILGKVAANQVDDLGDTSTLNDPSVVDDLVAVRKTIADKA